MPEAETGWARFLRRTAAFHYSFTRRSLRGRLLGLLLSSISFLWLVVALLAYFNARHEVDELFDAQLSESAKVLLNQANKEITGVVPESSHIAHEYERKIAFQIRDKHGNLLLRSATTPRRILSEHGAGFSDSLIDGHKWRVFTQWSNDREFQIQVGQRYSIRNELAGRIALSLLAQVLIALPLVAPLIWFALERGLKPIKWASDQVKARAIENLKPLERRDMPDEIMPLIESINTLLSRLEYSFENERRFTADAAHELRTPLAALKTHAQVAQRATDEAQRKRALDQVISGVDRSTHLVQQLLTLARIDPQVAEVYGGSADLHQVAVTVLSELYQEAHDRNIEMTLDEAKPVSVRGDGTMIGILLSNLVRNAIRYTSEGGSVAVRLSEDEEGALLEVIDNGPGIPVEEREKVFERFYRTLGNKVSGSGLGLSIVKRIADLHQATVTLDSGENGRGLWVKVRFQKR